MDKQYEEHIQHKFDSYCRTVLRNAARDYFDELRRRETHEVPLEECWELPYTVDRYLGDTQVYKVFDAEIPITDSSIAEALDALSNDNRIIVLAAYCMGLPDRVVADRLHLVRRTVAYRRLSTISKLRSLLKNE